jgi:uncharacterized pyridoxal phosphate-containing UPF0001 family protein
MKYPITGLTILQNFGKLKNSKKFLNTNTTSTTTTISIKKSNKIRKPQTSFKAAQAFGENKVAEMQACLKKLKRLATFSMDDYYSWHFPQKWTS